MSRPQHIAIIMDGNGRWAKSRGRPRNYGHLKGARVARSTIVECAKMDVEFLTLYAFSTENWLRPKEEVVFLMKLLERNIRKERATLMENNIKFKCIGDLGQLPAGVASEMKKTILTTEANTGMTLTFAVNYGGRKEIVDACKKIGQEISEGQLRPTEIDEAVLISRMNSSYMPDPDLIIRTSGEYRISNFLLWQCAYSEFYVTSVPWPEFDRDELLKAIASFEKRDRRFGQVPKSHIQENVVSK